MPKQIYIATESGTSEVDGEDLVFKKGVTLVEEGHGLLANCPDYFQPVEQHAHYESTAVESRAPARTRSKAK